MRLLQRAIQTGRHGTFAVMTGLSGAGPLPRSSRVSAGLALLALGSFSGPPPDLGPPFPFVAQALSDERPFRICPCNTSTGDQTRLGKPHCVLPEMPAVPGPAGHAAHLLCLRPSSLSRLFQLPRLWTLVTRTPSPLHREIQLALLSQNLTPRHPHWPEPLPFPHRKGLLAESLFCLCSRTGCSQHSSYRGPS